MAIPNTGVSVAGPGAALQTALEVVAGLDVSGATGMLLEAPGAEMVAGVMPTLCWPFPSSPSSWYFLGSSPQ